MSQTIDNRIVEMQFENKQFESGVQESLSTLDKLKAALRFDDASKNLDAFGKNISKNMDLSGLTKSVEGLNDRFSASGIAGMEVIRKLTDFAIEAGKTIAHALDAPFAQIREGGWKRAMNIEDAKFQLRGLEVAWETVAGDIDYAVADTAYGLDVAAKACAQLSASSVQAGDDMKAALRGISGVAAMGNTEYENISRIFTKAAGNGKVMAMELNQISQYGLNARASLRDFFNNIVEGNDKVKDIPEDLQKKVKALTKGMKVSESDINEFVHDSEIDFRTFSYAMDTAFGEHAKKANETFFGALSNIKAALSKIGAEFATPIIKGAIPIFNEIRVFLNDLRKQMGPVFAVFRNLTEFISGKVTQKLEQFRHAFLDLGGVTHVGNALKNVFTSVLKIIDAVKSAFDAVFPKTGSFVGAIVDATKGIDNFSKHLVISDQAAYVFRNVMVVVFNIIKALGSAIKAILPLIGKIANVALNIVSVITKVIACIMQLVSKLDIVQAAMAGIEKAGGLFAYALERIKDAFYYLKDVLSDTSTITGQVFAKIKDSAIMVAYIVGGSLYLAFVKLKELFSYFDAHDPLGSLLNTINKLRNLPVLKTIIGGMESAFSTIGKTISSVIKLFSDFIANINSGKTVIEALGITFSTVIGGAISLFGRLGDAIKSCFSAFQKDRVIEENVEMPIVNAGNAMSGVVKELTLTEKSVNNTANAFDSAKGSVAGFASTIVSKIRGIEPAKVILAAYATMLLVISYNANNLIKTITSLISKFNVGFFNMFKTGKTFWEKVTHGIMSITGAIVALAASMYMLAKIPADRLDAVTNSLLKLIGLAGGLSLLASIVTSLLSKFMGNGSGLTGFSIFSSNMFGLAAGIIAVAGALKLLDNIKSSGKELWEKVAVIGAIAVGLSTLSAAMTKIAPKLSAGGLSMLALSASILIVAKALQMISELNFTGLKENWKELSVIIISFGAFAALAGTIGISSIVSLLAFMLGLKTLIANLDVISTNLKKYKVGQILTEFFSELKSSISNAIQYAVDTYNSMSTLGKVMLAISGLLVSGGIVAILIAMSKAAQNVKSAALAASIFAVGMAGLMYGVIKIAEQCKSISPADITKSIAVLVAVGGLLTALIAVTGICAGDTTNEQKDIKGLFGHTNKSKTSTKNVSSVMKQTRKMLLDMGVLLASVALFVNVVGKLKPEELEQAKGLLYGTMAFIGAIMVVVTYIASNSNRMGKASTSAVAFVGIIALLGSILGAFVILMNYFKDYTFDAAGIGRIVTSLAVIGVACVAIYKFLQVLNARRSKNFLAISASFSLMVVAIGGIITLMVKNIKADEIGTTVKLGGILLGFLVVLSGVIVGLEALSNKLVNTKARRKAFATTLAGIGVMIAAVFAIGSMLSDLMTQTKSLSDVGRMTLIAAVVVGVLAAITIITLALERFAKNTKFTVTKTSQKSLIWSLSMIAGFIGSFVLLANTFKKMGSVDAGRMAGQAAIIVGALVALTALAEGILYLVKKMKTGWNDLAKAGAMLTTMVGLFAILSLIFKYIISDIPDPVGMIAKSQIIMLALYELAGLVAIVGVIAKLGAKIAGGEIALAAMIGLFALLTQVFKVIDGLQTEGILAKSQTIILVMTELIALIEVMGLLMEYTTGAFVLGAIAELVLWPMIKLFDLLSNVFVKINGLKTEGIMAKSQTIILVMTELIALIGVMGGLMYAAGEFALGGLAELALWPMILLFGLLADVFVKIDGMKTEGLLAKSQAIILVMTELVGIIALMGGLVYAAGEFALGGLAELALWPMILLFGLLADVFVKINEMKTEGLLAKSQAIVLVMTELVGIISVMGILVPLMAFGGLSELALAPMIGLFGQLSEVFMIIDKMHLEGLREKADIIVATLLKLEGLSALGGIIGGTVGGGLLLLAQGIQALGSACASVGAGIMIFSQSIDALAVSIQHLTATGPMISAWCANVSAGILTMSKSVVAAIKGLITGVASALVSGGAIVFAAAATLGKKLLEGFNSVVKPFVWGKELVGNFAKGIMSGVSAIANAALTVAKTVWSYLHFSEGSEVGPLSGNSVFTWGSHGGQNYANGWLSAIPGLEGVVSKIGSTLQNGIGNIDLSGQGLAAVTSLVQGLWSGSGALQNWANWRDSLLNGGSALTRMEKINQAIGKGASTRYDQVQKAINAENKAKKTVDALTASLEAQERGMKRSHASGDQMAKGTEKLRGQLEGATKAYKEACDETDRLAGITAGEAVPAIQNFGSALDDAGKKGGGAKEKTQELKDEIADFYDSIKSAINLFEEFNMETELTSDKLLENMRSQIQGVTEWSNQIQKLAFMGIDQGLLQQLADMGPQGYEYTNAFVHMTAEQLAEANNLYHQSLMLPSKVTSQVYGSYAVAGRSAASGFLQGMSQEDIKGAAVNFAHDVVDQMNLALDIVSGKSMVTYEDGVAVVNGVRTGMDAPYVKQNLETAVKLLSDNSIKQKFEDNLINNDQMYTIGTNITKGLARGVESDEGTNELRGAVIKVCQDAIKTAKSPEALNVKSPSRVFQAIGRFVTLGLAKGITDETRAATDAIGKTSKSIIDQMRETINQANQALIDDVDAPVITPVLDLSEIQSGSRQLDSMLSRNSALSASRSFTDLQNQKWNSQSSMVQAMMDNTDVVSAIGSLSSDIASLKDAMTNIKVMLDTGTMVGALTPGIDQQLGMRQVYAGRGI